MAVKLCLDDPYLLRCFSKIIERIQIHSKPGVILSQTVFYPIERLANRVIFENRDIISHEVDKSQIHQFPICKLSTVENHIRIIEK